VGKVYLFSLCSEVKVGAGTLFNACFEAFVGSLCCCSWLLLVKVAVLSVDYQSIVVVVLLVDYQWFVGYSSCLLITWL